MKKKVLSVFENYANCYTESTCGKVAKLYNEYTGADTKGQVTAAMFVSVCFVLATGLDKAKELLCGGLISRCPNGMKAFKDKGQLHETPRQYDVVFFLKNGVAYHTGFVYKVAGNSIYCIEATGTGFAKKGYTLNSSMLFGRPNYDVLEESSEPTVEHKPKAKSKGSSPKKTENV